ncbi:MAG: Calx-beta domain-containing protein, partial [Acidimicrobiales bacterium]
GTTWAQQAKLTAIDAAAGDRFGRSVAVSGDTAVVGAYLDDDAFAGTDSGSAHVFTRTGTTWAQQAKLTAIDAAAGDRFGRSVAVSGDTAVVGAPFDDPTDTDSGSAYVFTRTGATWAEQAKLTAADGAADDHFGRSVAVSGDTAVVGAHFDDDDDAGTDSGSAYVFTRTGTTWAQQAKLTAADAAAYDYFGYSVAVSGDTAVVGARGDDDAGLDSGSAYVFVPSPSTVSIDDVTVTEGDAGTTDATFTVTRSTSTGAATVEVQTVDATATAPSDYLALSTTVSFAEGETTKTVTVTVNGDSEVEPDEFFLVALSNPTGVEIADGEGTGAILNDDVAAPTTTTSTTTTPPGTVVTIDDTVASNGTRGRVSGTITCDAGRVFALRLSLTQSSASARGSTSGTCTGSPQPFAIDFTARGATFIAGSAEACVVPRTAVAGSRKFTSIGEVCEEVTIDV